jgi:hypothetical protein
MFVPVRAEGEEVGGRLAQQLRLVRALKEYRCRRSGRQPAEITLFGWGAFIAFSGIRL